MTSASPQRPTSYEILVRGELSEALVAALEPLRLRVEPGGMVALRGAFRDRSELLGALQALEDLGVDLIEVTPTEDG
ncbi:hypothetical protein [Mumia zhuanghuii]|uniref:Uncharacterized protein n=1 Tax=Mumia zhuanghuii TaxID=2585211 RepID=A0A5C4MJ33_9ACTN|nr:hypothetical protein [Mumia zhuanghuii]TNC42561.1 hypothetical protein FHE65_20705 [Mumia zhuanghuii]TNC43070.1 hypothetical protein FHE65_19590 [Mumia zhuanghuii]